LLKKQLKSQRVSLLSRLRLQIRSKNRLLKRFLHQSHPQKNKPKPNNHPNRPNPNPPRSPRNQEERARREQKSERRQGHRRRPLPRRRSDQRRARNPQETMPRPMSPSPTVNNSHPWTHKPPKCQFMKYWLLLSLHKATQHKRLRWNSDVIISMDKLLFYVIGGGRH